MEAGPQEEIMRRRRLRAGREEGDPDLGLRGENRGKEGEAEKRDRGVEMKIYRYGASHQRQAAKRQPDGLFRNTQRQGSRPRSVLSNRVLRIHSP